MPSVESRASPSLPPSCRVRYTFRDLGLSRAAAPLEASGAPKLCCPLLCSAQLCFLCIPCPANSNELPTAAAAAAEEGKQTREQPLVPRTHSLSMLHLLRSSGPGFPPRFARTFHFFGGFPLPTSPSSSGLDQITTSSLKLAFTFLLDLRLELIFGSQSDVQDDSVLVGLRYLTC